MKIQIPENYWPSCLQTTNKERHRIRMHSMNRGQTHNILQDKHHLPFFQLHLQLRAQGTPI